MKNRITQDEQDNRLRYPADERELYEKNQKLMSDWKASLKTEYSRDNFCSDGFYPHYTHQKEKILFVGQESYGLNGGDYINVFYDIFRSGHMDNGISINQSMFHRRAFYIAYGILHQFPAWKDVPYPDAHCDDIFSENGISFAFMNISKISPDCGYRHTKWDDVMRSVHEGANYIKEEVKLLAPDIVITMALMRDAEIRSALFDTCETVDCTDPDVHVYQAINGDKKMLVLDAWHFSAWKNELDCYYQPISNAISKYHCLIDEM